MMHNRSWKVGAVLVVALAAVWLRYPGILKGKTALVLRAAEQLLLYTLYYAEVWIGMLILFAIAWRLFFLDAWLGWRLCLAAQANNVNEVLRLLKAGVKPDSYKDYVLGGTALHYSCARGHVSVVRKLIEVGAEELILSPLRNGSTTIHLASEGGHVQVLQELIGAVSQTNRQRLLMQRAHNGLTCLHVAVLRGHAQVAKLLMKSGGLQLLKVNANEGKSCLHLAVSTGREDMVRMILEFPVDPNFQDDVGRTDPLLNVYNRNFTKRARAALHGAAYLGNVELCQALISAGANEHKPDSHGWTPVELARDRGHEAVVKLLQEDDVVLAYVKESIREEGSKCSMVSKLCQTQEERTIHDLDAHDGLGYAMKG